MTHPSDWMNQARKGLAYAESVRDGGDYEWACFAARHAAETALHTVLRSLGTDAKIRSIVNLCHSLSLEVTLAPPILLAAKRLDAYLPSQTDSRILTKEDADQGLADAEKLIDFCERLRSFLPGSEIMLLFRSQLIDVHTHRLQF
jgi:HEPN domain-containing protein